MIFSFFFPFFISANAESEFDLFLSDFYQKQEKATKILKEIEIDLKDGFRENDCARQKEAASYGIESTEALIKALKANDPETEIENLQVALEKWRELRDYC